MIVDQNKIAKKVRSSTFSKPSSTLRIMRKRKLSTVERRLNRFRLMMGFLILLSVSVGGAYLVYTLVEQYANNVELRSKNPETKSAKEIFYPVTYKPQQSSENK